MAPGAALACTPQVPFTNDTVLVDSCDPKSAGCKPASEVLARYADEYDSGDAVYSVAGPGNPWRLYDGDYRVLAVEDLAAQIRADPKFAKAKKVLLLSSWSGVKPNDAPLSVAGRLSAALDGFPVEGMDGFVWFGPKGHVRTTHQAFTGTRPVYFVRDGDEVMVSVVAMISPQLEQQLAGSEDPYAHRRIAASSDLYHMCPDEAVVRYEAAAARGDAVSAYNAAMIRLDRGGPGDAEEARRLLAKAADAGDEKARARLRRLP
jgi:hypothetical protein